MEDSTAKNVISKHFKPLQTLESTPVADGKRIHIAHTTVIG